MVGNNQYSLWGLKDSGEDITNDIIDIVNTANHFIVISGYNFSFRSAGITFFNELTHKANNGVPVLMIIPPRLAGKYNPQPRLITYCIANNIGVILNPQNHSKWLLTENDLYYGSSNFTPISWNKRVEVVSIHRHRNIISDWKRDTLLDFRKFIEREITDINSQSRGMNSHSGLVTFTLDSWNNIRPLIRRLNPSIKKVIETIENYGKIELELYNVIRKWFLRANSKDLQIIYATSFKILEKVNDLCDYAYANIYNESIKISRNIDKEVVIKYNKLHDLFIRVLDKQISSIKNHLPNIDQSSDHNSKILGLISKVQEKIKNTEI